MSSSPSHSSRSDGQAPTFDSASTDPATALHQITTERNSLRNQNDQLWKIIEKQRSIIQNLQKDVAKLSSERDLLRHHLTQQHQHHLQQQQQQQQTQLNGNQHRPSNDQPSSGSSSNGGGTSITGTSLAQVNGHHQQQSKRSLERKVQAAAEIGSTSSSSSPILTQPTTTTATTTTSDIASSPQSVPFHDDHGDLDDHSSTTSLTNKVLDQGPNTNNLPPTHSALNDSDNKVLGHPAVEIAMLAREQHAPVDASDNNNCNVSGNNSARPSMSNDDSPGFGANYDPEIQIATTASRIQHQSASPAIIIDKEARIIPARSDSSLSYTCECSIHYCFSAWVLRKRRNKMISFVQEERERANLATGDLWSPYCPRHPSRLDSTITTISRTIPFIETLERYPVNHLANSSRCFLSFSSYLPQPYRPIAPIGWQ
jgi:hypothetical protein